MRVISPKKAKDLRPVAVLKEIGHKVYDEAYKLYRSGSTFVIISCCMPYHGGCGLHLAFEQKDLKEASCGGYGGFDSCGDQYRCPRCGAKNWIDSEIFPALLSLAK